MTAQPDFGRGPWEYRFYDEGGLITASRFPRGLSEQHHADEDAWQAADLFKRERNIIVTKIERRTPVTGEWREIPKL